MAEDKKEIKIFTFGEVKPYIMGLEFKQGYHAYVERYDIIHQAEKNNAPPEIINVLLKLEDRYYHFYYEIQEAFMRIQQVVVPESEKTPVEKLKMELDEQKKVCESKDGRISVLEERSLFYRKLGWAISYILLVWFPVAVLYVHMWITIASNGFYNVFNANFEYNAPNWIYGAGSDVPGICLSSMMILLYIFTYLGFIALWCLIWDDE